MSKSNKLLLLLHETLSVKYFFYICLFRRRWPIDFWLNILQCFMSWNINPIQDVGQKGLPYQIFPCDFYNPST